MYRPSCTLHPGFFCLSLPPGSCKHVRPASCSLHAPNNDRSASIVCKHRVSGSLSLPSRGAFHLSFTVLFSIGHQGVFSLTGWSPRVQTRFHVSRLTLDTAMLTSVSPTGLSPPVVGLPRRIRLQSSDQLCGPNPGMHALRFGLFRVRSPLLTESLLFSLPPAT